MLNTSTEPGGARAIFGKVATSPPWFRSRTTCSRATAIELNPVRARLVAQPDEYPWSSYAANAKGQGSAPVTPHDEYVRLGRDAAERQAVYRDTFGSLIAREWLTEIRTAIYGVYALGSTAFKRDVARVLGRRVERGSAGRPARSRADDEQLNLL